jgi:methylenetetrahydrofolate dehydrogenase (NADP+) / methenyltetrahydrofolate cyclohydrolase
MNVVRINGTEIAEKIFAELKKRVARLAEDGKSRRGEPIIPHLVVILVGENPASVAYVTLKQKKGEAIGAKVSLIKYKTDVTTEELAEKVLELNEDPSVHGILIQRPLPKQIDVNRLELLTNPEKDVDGFHPDSPFTLPLPLAVVKILQEVYEETNGTKETSANRASDSSYSSVSSSTFLKWLKAKNIVVLGKGPTGGGPIIKLLNKMGVQPTVIDSKTENPAEVMRNADIIISSVGRENVVKPENIKPGAILVGVGILRGEDSKLKGDYDPEKIKDIAGYYTPTPGGVGPVNVAMLMENLLDAAEKQ